MSPSELAKTPCPKCDADLPRDVTHCPACGMPRALSAFGGGGEPREGEPIVDPLLEVFERDPVVLQCPNCMNEFEGVCAACRRCGGIPLVPTKRSVFERALTRRPIHDTGRSVATGPPDHPRDLCRVALARGLHEAACLEKELRFMGLEPVLGSDSLDPFDAPGRVGVYVRERHSETAAYVVDGFRPQDPLDRPPEQDPAVDRLDEARGWFRIGKYAETVRCCDALDADAESEVLAVRSLLLAGRARDAERRALGAANMGKYEGTGRGRLLAWLGLVRALGYDGTAFGRGAEIDGARRALEEAIRVSSRSLLASKALIEVLDHQGDRQALKRELRRIDRINPNLLGTNGAFRDLRASLEEGAA